MNKLLPNDCQSSDRIYGLRGLLSGHINWK